MDEPDEAVKQIADKLGVYVVGAEMKGFGLFNSDNNIILYNEKLKPVTRRMIILHELGHALSTSLNNTLIEKELTNNASSDQIYQSPPAQPASQADSVPAEVVPVIIDK